MMNAYFGHTSGTRSKITQNWEKSAVCLRPGYINHAFTGINQ